MYALPASHLSPARHEAMRRLLPLVVWFVPGAVVAVLSAGDLALTLEFMGSIGLPEENPIARVLAALTGSQACIALFKALSLAAASLLLYGARRSRLAPIALWLMAMILVALTIRWYEYLDALAALPVDDLVNLHLDEAIVVRVG